MHNLKLALRHHVDQVAHRALLEQHLAGLKMYGFRWPICLREIGCQLNDAIGHRQHPAVVGCDHDHTLAIGQFADQPQHLLHLDEIQVCGRFVSEDQWRIQRNRACHRDSLLLTSAQITGSMIHSFREIDARQQFFGTPTRRPA
ncbi:Uncharacterised protein [Mycobacterium tuberculosis]|nr:Uncharacterised protein [Mycobacterium tuberculosis]COW39806.1 Uncharacterised protein [Mycobacterium tuberculosis]